LRQPFRSKATYSLLPSCLAGIFLLRKWSIKIAEQLKIEQDNKDKYMNALVKLYRSQVHIIQNSGQFVTAEQKNAIEAAMKTLEKLTNKGYRTGKFSNDTNIPDTLFTTLLDEIIENCPIITSVIESLLVFNKKGRNVNKTATYKMLCASHASHCQF
jgi:hypothetical protein